MKKLLLLLSIAYIGQVNGQNWLWSRAALSTAPSCASEGWSTCTDTLGNVFFTGTFSGPTIGFGNDTLVNADSSYSDLFLLKYNSVGNLLWATSARGRHNDQATSINTDNDGNLLMTGIFQSPYIIFGNDTLRNADTTFSENMFIVKYNPLGNVLWAKRAGDTIGTAGMGICSDSHGNIFVTGSFGDPTLTLSTYTLTNSGSNNFFLAKYNSIGNVLWAKSAGGADSDGGFSVATDILGNVFVTGEFTSTSISFGTTTLNNIGTTQYSDIFLAKYDSSGNPLWARSAGSTSYDAPSIVVTDKIGNAYVNGYFSSPGIVFGTYSLTSAASANSFLTKYDSFGNVKWAKSPSVTTDNYGFFLSTDKSGNIYETGSFGSSITFGTQVVPLPVGASDPMYIVKYDSTGYVQCAIGLSTGGDDQNSVSTDKFGNIFISGDFTVNPFILGNDTLKQTWGETAFISKLTLSCSNIGIEEQTKKENLIIYPNPTSDQFFIDANTTDKLNVDLYDINGRHVFSTSAMDKSNINVTTLDEGIYTMTIKSVDRVTNKKLVIVR